MAKNNNLTDFLTSMANYIRGKFPNSFAGTPLDPQGFESAIDWGVNQAVESALQTGRELQQNDFWNSFQDNGNRTDYKYAFHCWTETCLLPKYPIIISGNAQDCFSNLQISGTLYCEIDTSNMTGAYGLFGASSGITKIVSPLDFSKTTETGYCFNLCTSLQTVSIISSETTSWTTTTFNRCDALKNLTMSGTIGKNGFQVTSTVLSKASITSIINALSSSTSGLSIKLSRTAKNNAFTDSEWATLIATKPNWTINLA